MTPRGRAILSGVLVAGVILVAVWAMSPPDVVTVLLAIAIGVSVALSMWAREGVR